MGKKAVKYFAVVTFESIMRLVFSLPRYRLLNRFKASILRLIGAKVGRRVVFYPGVWVMTGKNLEIGDDVDLALDVLITTAGGVRIGDRALIGYRTQIISSNHRIPTGHGRVFDAGHDVGQVVIGSDVWIGAACIVLPGTKIGEGAVVAAGSVITKDVEPFSVVAGVPARKIRDR